MPKTKKRPPPPATQGPTNPAHSAPTKRGRYVRLVDALAEVRLYRALEEGDPHADRIKGIVRDHQIEQLDRHLSRIERVGPDERERGRYLDTCPENMTLPANHLARIGGVSYEALRKRLDRLRKKDHRTFVESSDRTVHEAQYLYYVWAAKPIIAALKAGAGASVKRPSGKI